MNWNPIGRERFRDLLKQGEGLTIRGGCIYSSTGGTIGTYAVWLRSGQPYLKHEAYYNGKELYFIQAERDTLS